MSVSLDNKRIVYLNLSKTGRESLNSADSQEFCEVKLSFRDSPLLDKQDDYVVAATRFGVPLSEVPTIQKHWFEIRSYDPAAVDLTGAGANLGSKGYHDFDIDERGKIDETISSLVHHFELPTAYSTYQWLESLQNALNVRIPHGEINGDAYEYENQAGVYVPYVYKDRVQLFCTPDMRFKLYINNDSATESWIRPNSHWYVRMSPGLFSMLQWQQSFDVFEYKDSGGLTHKIPENYNVMNLRRRRFFTADYADEYQVVQRGSNPTAVAHATMHTTHMSCSEMSVHRRIVFSSDLAVVSERNSQSTYRRFLADYKVSNDTTFSYSLTRLDYGSAYLETIGAQTFKGFIDNKSTVSEPLPSTRIYTSMNASGGRFQNLSLPSALHQITVRAELEIWDYELGIHRMVPIPLPHGSLFDLKLIFISKKDPDAIQEHTNQFHA